MNKELEKALECCSKFLCDECPYQKYDSHNYPIRCIHILVVDVYKEIKEKENGTT